MAEPIPQNAFNALIQRNVNRLEGEAIKQAENYERQDLINKANHHDPMSIPTNMPGIVQVDTQQFNDDPVWPVGLREKKSGATLLIGGVDGTWHSMEKWVPDLAARTQGPVYAYEGLGGPGSKPHKEQYMDENIKALADALIQIREADPSHPKQEITIQTYSVGGVVGQAVIQELKNRQHALGGSELDQFGKINLIALFPPDCGFSGVDTLNSLPEWFVNHVVRPITKEIGYAATLSMGPNGSVLNSIAQGHPSNVELTRIRGVGDRVSSSQDDKSEAQAKKMLNTADHTKTVAAGHTSGVNPFVLRDQGINIYEPSIQTSREALTLLEGMKPREFANARQAEITESVDPLVELLAKIELKEPHSLSQPEKKLAQAPVADQPAVSGAEALIPLEKVGLNVRITRDTRRRALEAVNQAVQSSTATRTL